MNGSVSGMKGRAIRSFAYIYLYHSINALHLNLLHSFNLVEYHPSIFPLTLFLCFVSNWQRACLLSSHSLYLKDIRLTSERLLIDF
jgi:hypothetical protein